MSSAQLKIGLRYVFIETERSVNGSLFCCHLRISKEYSEAATVTILKSGISKSRVHKLKTVFVHFSSAQNVIIKNRF